MAITLDGTNGINSSGVIVAPDGSASAPAITNDGDTNTGIFFPAADTIAFAEGGTEAMRIDSSGRTLIGSTSARANLFNSTVTAPLQVEGTSSDTANILIARNTNDATGTVFTLAKSRGTTVGSNTVVQNGDGTGLISFQGSDGTQFVETARITSIVNGTPGADDMPGALIFSTTADGAAAVTERMRIDSSGNLLVGTTAPFTTGVDAVMLKGGDGGNRFGVSGTAAANNIILYNGNGAVGLIQTSGSSTAYLTSSDYRLKHDIQPMIGALAKVQQLKPVTYKWNADNSESQGFIAHELAEIVPEAVSGEKDAVNEDGSIKPQGIDTSFLVATLTAAIQELKAELDTVKAELADLKGQA
jgi:hypothetical protein